MVDRVVGDGLDEPRPLRPDVVDRRRHRVQGEICGGSGLEETTEGVGVVERRIEPEVPGVGRQHHRHTVVNPCDPFVRWPRDDGAGLDPAARGGIVGRVGVTPAFPQTHERQRRTVHAMDEERCLGVGAVEAGPLVEPVGADDAATFAERRTERVLRRERLRPGVDHLVADTQVLRPGRYEAPPERLETAVIVAFDDDRHRGGGRDVVPGLVEDLPHLVDTEVRREDIRWRGRHEPSTHGCHGSGVVAHMRRPTDRAAPGSVGDDRYRAARAHADGLGGVQAVGVVEYLGTEDSGEIVVTEREVLGVVVHALTGHDAGREVDHDALGHHTARR